MKPYVFLDRDGTVIVEKNYLSDPAQVELLPGAGAGLRRLRTLGFGLILITNQAGVGRGFFPERDVLLVHARLAELLEREQVQLDAVYYCPHHPDAGCGCRKPRPGMLDRAISEFDIDLTRSVVIGDKPSDIGLGESRGLRTILVRTGEGAEHEQRGDCSPSLTADDLISAAAWISDALCRDAGRGKAHL
ncbi:MAG: HAD family hydrolase [Lentisphaeria bacterium]|nr:HAD family hydrolase [Lentisphaeria bacterium]